MTNDFKILVEWVSAAHGRDEVRETSAFLSIVVDGRTVTRAEDDWSKSVQTRVRLSAYPLAVWLAASWWRLRWEPAPWGPRSVSWRMAHHLSAAGGGFLWPDLIFETDGRTVDAICRPSDPQSTEPVRYLTGFRSSIPAELFEREIDGFLALVLARLDAVGVRDAELARLWREVQSERGDARLSTMRRLEAMLGFEPDEASSELLERFGSVGTEAGAAAMEEIAPACAGEESVAALERIVALARSAGVAGRIVTPKPLLQALDDEAYATAAPWERGRLLAHDVRRVLGFGAQPVPDPALSQLVHIPTTTLAGTTDLSAASRIGLAVRHGDGNDLTLHFRKQNRPGRRFEAARFLADHLLATPSDRWLPVTDTRTARQKMQRAFAAEFLSPIDALQQHLGGDFSNEAIEDVADEFGVSSLAVRSHLANNDLIPYEAVFG